MVRAEWGVPELILPWRKTAVCESGRDAFHMEDVHGRQQCVRVDAAMFHTEDICVKCRACTEERRCFIRETSQLVANIE